MATGEEKPFVVTQKQHSERMNMKEGTSGENYE
jgi:hypothetical protein